MHDTSTYQASPTAPSGDAVGPSAVGSKPFLTNPVGFDFVTREIAQRNPLVRQALERRAQGQAE